MADTEPGYDRIMGRSFASRSEIIAPHGMAATSQPLVTQIALDILKAGGSAVDAAIAANAALGLMEPTGSGIGGDLFAIIWDAERKELTGLNASGRAPALMTLSYFEENGLRSIPDPGPLPISVPGAVDGWFELHGRYGRLPMADVLAPAIAYAKAAFRFRKLSRQVLRGMRKYWASIRDFPRPTCRMGKRLQKAKCSATRALPKPIKCSLMEAGTLFIRVKSQRESIPT